MTRTHRRTLMLNLKKIFFQSQNSHHLRRRKTNLVSMNTGKISKRNNIKDLVLTELALMKMPCGEIKLILISTNLLRTRTNNIFFKAQGSHQMDLNKTLLKKTYEKKKKKINRHSSWKLILCISLPKLSKKNFLIGKMPINRVLAYLTILKRMKHNLHIWLRKNGTEN